jgi:hypothetical protein
LNAQIKFTSPISYISILEAREYVLSYNIIEYTSYHKINTKASYRLQLTIKTPLVNHYNYNNLTCINTYIQLYKAILTTITSTKP